MRLLNNLPTLSELKSKKFQKAIKDHSFMFLCFVLVKHEIDSKDISQIRFYGFRFYRISKVPFIFGGYG